MTRRRRQTPRDSLVDMLCDLGFAACVDDITWVRGAHSHITSDVTHRWVAVVQRVSDQKRVEITGSESITKCVRYGFTLSPAGGDYYGDFVATPKL